MTERGDEVVTCDECGRVLAECRCAPARVAWGEAEEHRELDEMAPCERARYVASRSRWW